MIALAAAAAWLIAVNAVTYVVWSRDKTRACHPGARRVPEATLLRLALLGGLPAARLAQRRLRHKTRKEPFRGALNAIYGLHLVLLFGGAALLWVPGARDGLLAMLPG